MSNKIFQDHFSDNIDIGINGYASSSFYNDIYYYTKSFGKQNYKYEKYDSRHGHNCQSNRNWNQSGFVKKLHRALHKSKRTKIRNTIDYYYKNNNLEELSIESLPLQSNYFKNKNMYRIEKPRIDFFVYYN